MNDAILLVLKMQAWERAKAELESILQCYHGDAKGFGLARDKIRAFIKDFEDWCC